MRQIQDLTFKVARGLDAIDRRRNELRQSFQKWTSLNTLPPGIKRVCYRITCLPGVTDCHLERVHGVDEVKPRLDRIAVKARGGKDYQFGPTIPYSLQFRPMLRGTEAGKTDDMQAWRIQLHCDGAVTYEFWRDTIERDDDELPIRQREHLLYPDSLFAAVINALEAAGRFRRAAGASTVDYACDIEIVASHELPVPYLGQTYDDPRRFRNGTHLLPTYVLGPIETRDDTLSLMWRDFWNALGLEYGDWGLKLA